MKKSIKFESIDVLETLSKIVELHTRHYKEDFDLDRELIPKLALSPNPEDKHILWMSRPCGTHVLREQNIYLKDTYEHNTWKFYHEQTKEPILAYAVSLDKIQHGKVIGTVYPLNYASHVEHIKQLALPIRKVSVTFEDTQLLWYGKQLLQAALLCLPYGIQLLENPHFKA